MPQEKENKAQENCTWGEYFAKKLSIFSPKKYSTDGVFSKITNDEKNVGEKRMASVLMESERNCKRQKIGA